MRNNHIKIRREPDEKFLSGFTNRDITGDPMVVQTEDPNISLTRENGGLRAQLELPEDINEDSLRFVEEQGRFSIYFQGKKANVFKKVEVPKPKDVTFQKEKSTMMDGVLHLFFN